MQDGLLEVVTRFYGELQMIALAAYVVHEGNGPVVSPAWKGAYLAPDSFGGRDHDITLEGRIF